LEGRRLLERAIELQPDYGDAYSELSNSYIFELQHWNFDPALLSKAAEFARKGLSLSPLSPLAYTSLGLVELTRFRPQEAIRLATRGLELAPSDFGARSVRGIGLLMLGQTSDAIESLEQAVALNPAAPDVLYTVLGTALFASGRHAEAAKLWERVRAANPEAILDRMSLIRHYQAEGLPNRAELIAREILEIDPEFKTEEAVETFEMSLPTPSDEDVAEVRHSLSISGLP
jgi:tetratricopeptide (TPR) repeat protein